MVGRVTTPASTGAVLRPSQAASRAAWVRLRGRRRAIGDGCECACARGCVLRVRFMQPSEFAIGAMGNTGVSVPAMNYYAWVERIYRGVSVVVGAVMLGALVAV